MMETLSLLPKMDSSELGYYDGCIAIARVVAANVIFFAGGWAGGAGGGVDTGKCGDAASLCRSSSGNKASSD